MTEPTQERVVIIRPSFKKFCGNDACRAAAFNHLLYWIAKKTKGEPLERIKKGEIAWYGSGEEITSELDDSWSVNKVRQEVKNLVSDGLIGQRRNPQNGWFQTRHYFFGEEQANALKAKCDKLGIILAHLALPAEIVHLLNLVNAFTKCGESNCQICEMDLPNLVTPITKSGKCKTQITTQDSTQESNSEKKRTSREKSKTIETGTPSSPLFENSSSESSSFDAGETIDSPKEIKGATLFMLPEFSSQDEEEANAQTDNAPKEQASGASYSQESTPKLPSEDEVEEKPSGPPQLPPPNARLSAELVVRLIEFKKGRAYSDDTHRQELNAAKKLLKLIHNGKKLTRDDIQYGLDDMFSWPFWEGKSVKPMLRTLLKDEKILTILDNRKEIKQTTQTAAAMAEATQSRDEKNQAQLEKMRQRKAAQDAKKQKQVS